MPDRYSRIFLLSHMRACTSLAGHILGSHPRINGYYEMHISYEQATDLDRQLAAYQACETLKEDSHYLFDKLLHNDYRLLPRQLQPTRMETLVCLQQPARTIRSIVDLFAQKGSHDPYATPEGATGYYVERLDWLADFCRSTTRPYHYYDAELFQVSPGQLLQALSGWLQLDSPLAERYRLFSQTGVAGRGDSSSRIRIGRIDRDQPCYDHVQLPAVLLRQAEEAYGDCRATVIRRAADTLTRSG